jgi:RimJ/RimL family protein N-acetyltransferase
MLSKKIQLRGGQGATIRLPKPEDAVRILAYLNRVFGETDYLAYGKGDLDWPIEKERKFIEGYLDSDNKFLIIALIRQSIVGTLGFTGDEKTRLRHTGEFGMAVLRKHWGLGIGAALIECMIEWARSSGIVRKINLRVRVDNQRALSLYERFGFTREGIVRRQFAVADKFYDAYFMGLEIDP